jgi:suppressor for copper-sensitivity B
VRSTIIGVILFLLSVNTALAVEGDWVENGPVQARLISPLLQLPIEPEIPLALELKIEKGWKTYWKVPGAAGAAPKVVPISEELSPEVKWYWPAPESFTLLGLQSYGYENHVIIPFDLTRVASTRSNSIDVKTTVYVCNEICLPLTLPLTVTFNSIGSDLIDWETSRLYNEFKSLEPKESFSGTVSALSDANTVYLDISLPQPGKENDAFIENLYVYEWPAPTIVVSGSRVQFWWSRPSELPELEIKTSLKFTYKDSLQAFSIETPFIEGLVPELPDYLVESNVNVTSLWVILAFALVGGFILNAMPCVLPVLSIKFMSWIELRQTRPAEIRKHGIATSMGIISFFWIIAGGLTLLKLSGAYVGWGIQFQNPWFLLFLVVLMAVFLANLLGRFEIQLPDIIQGRLTSVGTQRKGLLKSYLQGGTATLMATPCSAPFLGTAVSFALTQSVTDLWLIFTVLGVGLSLPYWTVVFWPSAIYMLPKPGKWMLVVKKFMAAGLGLTLVWLVYLLSDHLNSGGLSLIILTISIWIASLFKFKKTRTVWLSLLVFLTSLMGSLFAFQQISTPGTSSVRWEAYSQDQLTQHLSKQHTVLVDVTAEWCITCKFNEATVLGTKKIQRYFKEKDVVRMRADWTHPDTRIEALLSTYDRSAIPFNLVLGPGEPNGILLPELLTVRDVKEAIEHVQQGN